MPNLPRRPTAHSDYLQPSPRPQKKKSRTGCWKAVVVIMSLLCLGATGLSTYCIIKLFNMGGNATNDARSHMKETQINDRKRLDRLEKMIDQFARFNNISKLSDSPIKDNGLVKLEVLMQAHDREIALLQAQLPVVNRSVFENKNDLNSKLSTLGRRISSVESNLVNISALLIKKISNNAKSIEKQQQDVGWIPLFNGYEYLVQRIGFNFTQCREFCKRKGGDLVTVGMRNNVTRKYLAETLVPGKTLYSVWIGLSDLKQEGTWNWIDGVRATTGNTHFARGEPNNFGTGQDCAYVHEFAEGYRMADYYCSSRFSALCERKI